MELQYNEISRKVYQGKNQAELQAVKADKEFKSNAWLTFLQAKDKGLKIKKGSKGVSIFKGFIEVEVKDKQEKTKTETKPAGYATVFNLDQTEVYKEKK